MPSWKLRIIESISVGSPERVRYLPQQLSVDRVVRFLHIDEAHVQGDSLWSELLQTGAPTNRASIVDRAGRKPHSSPESITSVSQ